MEETIVKKKSAGRRKIEIKKIEDPQRLRVSFSKRRKGLFQKGANLKNLCGVDVAIIVQYPGGKVKASGDESEIYPIIDSYLAACGSSSSGASIIAPDQALETNKEEKEEIMGLTTIDQTLNNIDEKGFSWKDSFDDEKSDRLEEYIASLESLLENDDGAPSSSLTSLQNFDCSAYFPVPQCETSN